MRERGRETCVGERSTKVGYEMLARERGCVCVCVRERERERKREKERERERG